MDLGEIVGGEVLRRNLTLGLVVVVGVVEGDNGGEVLANGADVVGNDV